MNLQTIAKFEAEATAVLGADWGVDIDWCLTNDDASPGTWYYGGAQIANWSAGGTTYAKLDDEAGADMAGLIIIMAAHDSGTLASDVFLQLREVVAKPRIVDTALRVDEAIALCTFPAVTTTTTAIGGDLPHIHVDEHCTAAEAAEQFASKASVPILAGFWDDGDCEIKPRPTAPPNRQRWYAVDDSMDIDWNVEEQPEERKDYVLVTYDHEPADDVQVPTPPDAAWVASWTRSDTNCFSTDPGGGFVYCVRSNATHRNPQCYPTDMRPCVPNELYLVRARARLTAYPGDGTAWVDIYWYTAAGAYISLTTLKSFVGATTEAWYEETMQAPATAYQYRPGLRWTNVTVGAGDYDLLVRDIWFAPAIPAGTPLSVYYPSQPNTWDVRLARIDTGQQLTTVEATAVATTAYTYRHDNQATGGCSIRGRIRTIDGAPVEPEHIRAWDWIQNTGELDTDGGVGGPYMITEVTYSGGVAECTLGGVEWAYLAPDEYSNKTPYVGGRTYKKRVYIPFTGVKGPYKNLWGWKEVTEEGHYV
jgi:hypothetical protein